MIDVSIVMSYFIIIFVAAFSGRTKGKVSVENYFLSDRNLKWHSIAISTIATNVSGYQFLGMMGSAYLFGLAQANLEINAVQGILMAAFIFVPLYLRERITTITQFIEKRLGKTVGLFYTLANISLFATLTLGAALFWGAYAAELVFEDHLLFLHEDRVIRIAILIFILGAFSASYTYLGGLNAVVKTDIIQFVILILGGCAVLFVAVKELGGFRELYVQTPELMHLHLPADHEKLPWTHVFGLFFLNINYWCANQTVMQRSIAAKSLKHAQVGLMVGGITKYFMALLIVIPGIALVGILGQNGLADPDQAFPYIVKNYIPIGLKGLILCGLFASLMSTVDSTFNSLATLFSIDIYKRYLRKDANEDQIVQAGRNTILFTFFTGVLMGFILLYVKFNNPEAAFTHTLNELRYYINCGIVVLIVSAVFMLVPNKKAALLVFLSTAPLNIFMEWLAPEMNYFVRAGWVITIGLALVAVFSFEKGFPRFRDLIIYEDKRVAQYGVALLVSLIVLHVIFH